jgi:hypothetical protein
MQTISSSADLKYAIQTLQAEQITKGHLLKQQLIATQDTFRPVNLLKNAMVDVSASPYLIENLVSIAMGMASGFLTRKLFIGKSGNIIRKVVGSLLQFSVTDAVAHRPDAIRSIGSMIMQFFLRKKEHIQENRER